MADPKQRTTDTKVAEEVAAELSGDTLELVLSKMHLVHLFPAGRVNKSWNSAASSSIRRHRRPMPWLIFHTQTTTAFPYRVSARAYDPDSHVWLDIAHNSTTPINDYVSTPLLRSSHSTLLYTLSPSIFAFSLDALHLQWHHADTAPRVWRNDPVVAKIGHRVVVACGACSHEDDPLAVEIYDMERRAWDACGSMPAFFKDSSACTWLSVAADEKRMYVMEKCSGLTYSFDPERKKWLGPYDLCPNPTVVSSAIGFTNGGLVLSGVVGEAELVEGVKLWEVKKNDNGVSLELGDMIGEMSETMLEKLKGESEFPPSIAMTCMEGLVCLHNNSDPSEMILCELERGECRWTSIRNEAVKNNDAIRMHRMVVTCTSVGLPELQKAVQVGALKLL